MNELGDFFIICILKINHLEDKASPGASHLWMSQKKLIFKWKKEYGSEKEQNIMDLMEYVCEEQKINAKPDMISKVEWIQK